MRDIAELTMLLRGHPELPGNLTLVKEEFREGWNFVQSGDAHWLDKTTRTHGWHFVRIADESIRSGVGPTSQEAIASALKQALRHVGDGFIAANVEHIEVKEYPWFVLAKVRVNPYQVQPSTGMSVSAEAASLSIPYAAGTPK